MLKHMNRSFAGLERQRLVRCRLLGGTPTSSTLAPGWMEPLRHGVRDRTRKFRESRPTPWTSAIPVDPSALAAPTVFR